MANRCLHANYSVHDTEGYHESHDETKESNPVLSYASQLQRRVLPVETRFSYLEVCAGIILPDERFASNLDSRTFNRHQRIPEKAEVSCEVPFVQSGIASMVRERFSALLELPESFLFCSFVPIWTSFKRRSQSLIGFHSNVAPSR